MENLNTLIIGYGRTGRAVLDFLKKNNAAAGKYENKNNKNNIAIYDEFLNDSDINKLNQNDDGVLFFNNNSAQDFLKNRIDEIGATVISPGIQRNNHVVLLLRRRRKRIYSEIEFAYKNLMQDYNNCYNYKYNSNSNNYKNGNNNYNNNNNDGGNETADGCGMKLFKPQKPRILAITGTNGKTTATSMCSAAASVSGIKAFTGGNFGVPFIESVGDKDCSNFILEISSFQLEWIYEFNPDVAVLLNVQDDHLDRYENFDEYRLTKYKIFKNHTINDTAILNYEDYNAAIVKDTIGSLPVLFGFDENKCNIYYKDESIYFKLKEFYGIDDKISLKDFKDKRKFVIEDMMAASGALLAFGIPLDAIEKSFKDYKLLKHRVEFIGNIDNINFYDDSKATNPAAVISALESVKSPVVLILGGKDKGFNYDILIEPVKKHVRACILIGETADMIYKTLNGAVDIMRASDMDDAVKKAYNAALSEFESRANSGVADSLTDFQCSVLLSPASSSFDMFKDYNERGEVFKKCFNKLKETKSITI
jgi:UDP-N-acetylmuramoylalanine--D-glutamate ligase